MTAGSRFAWVFGSLIALAALTGCPNKKPSPGGDAGVDGGCSCLQDSDCPDQNLFYCNTATQCCEPSCRSDSDCTAANRGVYALPYCNGQLGCVCDEGTCVSKLCSADTDCGAGAACRNGQCLPQPPSATTVTSCQVSPDYVVLKQGASAKFWVSGWDANNNPVVLQNSDYQWTTGAGSNVTLSTSSGNSAVFQATTAGSSAIASVKAQVGSATCTAQVLVVGPTITANNVTVIAIDELTGRPIPSATVMVSTAGAAVGTPVTTAADGTATIPATGTVDVSVFHTDYAYQTIVGYSVAAAAPTGDQNFLSFYLRRNQSDKIGGYKGTFSNLPASPNIQAGIAGMSIAGTITDLSLTQLLGNTVDTEVKLGNQIDQTVPLPVGVYLAFNGTPIKTTDSADGLAGICTTALVTDPSSSIANGSCGTRSAWALEGDVALADLPIDQFTGGLNNINFGNVLARIIPIFRKFNSSIGRDIQFTLQASDGGYDTTNFTSFDHDYTKMLPLGFDYALNIPSLPQYQNTYVDGVIALAGTNVPGRGVVPLGIGAAVNTSPADNLTDVQAPLTSQGLMTMRQAPTHDGLEGDQYGIIVLGTSLKSATGNGGIAASALFQRIAGNALAFDPNGASPVAIGKVGGSQIPFLSMPEGAKMNFSSTVVGQYGLGTRTFKFVSPVSGESTGVNVVRAVISNDRDHRWVVVMDPAAISANGGFTLPAVPSGFEDRLYNSNGSQGGLLVQLMRIVDDPLAASPNAISFTQLVEFNSTNADRITDYAVAFSLDDYSSPGVSWTTPKDNSQPVAAGSQVTVKVSHFNVGTSTTPPVSDGIVKFSITGGNAACQTPMADGTVQDPTSGAVNSNLPAGCTGTISVTAQLYNAAGTAYDPPVSAPLNNLTVQ